jgi:hypothetical protein
MDHEENDRKHEKKVKETRGHVINNEGSDPCEEQNKREDKKYEPHLVSILVTPVFHWLNFGVYFKSFRKRSLY